MTIRKITDGYPPLYVLSAICFIMALGGDVVLMASDILHHYAFSSLHGQLDSWPLIMVGSSYIFAQLAKKRNRVDQIKGIFLGVAFLLWGGELLIPPSWKTTVMDEGAVTIFVIDLSFIIWGHISLADESHLP